MITLNDVYAARYRIQPHVRRTPLIAAMPTKTRPPVEGDIFLKLEYMQISGSFKARGAVNRLFSLPPEQVKRGVVAASGGNHGLGVAYAGWLVGCPVTIYLGKNVPTIKIEKLESWGARCVIEGEIWDDANAAALAFAEREQLPYLHPFADPVVIAGQGTVALEILEDLREVDTIIAAIGGGGLISGVSLTAKAINPKIRIIGVEPVGAPTLYESLRAGHPVELASVTSIANTLAPRSTAAINFEIIQQHVDKIVLVTDEEMRTAAQWLYREFGIASELSGAASMAALLTRKVPTTSGEKICALVCGAGTDGIEHL